MNVLKIPWDEYEKLAEIFKRPDSSNLWYKEEDDRFIFLFFLQGAAVSAEKMKSSIWEPDDDFETKEQKIKEFIATHTAHGSKFTSYGGL